MKSGISAEISHYKVDANEYINAIRSGSDKSEKLGSRQGLRRSPIPHLRRDHERFLQGKRTWVHYTLVNIKKASNFAFAEKRLVFVVK